MLPILPAILLLLFKGPAFLERMVHDGRLPAAVEAVQQLDRAPDRADSRSLAGMIAASKDPGLTHALVAILHWIDSPKEVAEARIEPPSERLVQPIDPGPPVRIRDGFQSAGRSRDGPSFC